MGSDEDDNKVLWAESGCFQWGICCPFPCGPCKYVNFPIKDRSNNQVGELKKQMRGCFKCAAVSGCLETWRTTRLIALASKIHSIRFCSWHLPSSQISGISTTQITVKMTP